MPRWLLRATTESFAPYGGLPTFEVEGRTLYRRLTFVAAQGRIVKVFYPVFPPDRDAGEVLAWLGAHAAEPEASR